MTLLKCLKCNAQLCFEGRLCVCSECGTEWPLSGGIPRFFDAPSYYWGEVTRKQAQNLLAAAREGSWIEAVRTHFPQEDPMVLGILDLQRASWSAMLGLDRRSLALDVGSGYGAITQSLSRLVGEVYSIEAIPERIEFTQARLSQEGIQNVTLIQASATALPLRENSFDLVVANGVLEWVGEWDLEGDPRTVQVKFLRSLCRLLKDDGVLVVGIENRIGFGMFLGTHDHSGLPFTSLVPRRIASLMLRMSTSSHHRTKLNSNREYRTYTYCERGYRKLLAEAGFTDVSCYWADPGYNLPHHLIPLSRPDWVREHFQRLLDHPGPAPRQSWRRTLKRMIAPSRILGLTVPEFLLLASKRPRCTTEAQSWMAKRLLKSDRSLNPSDGASQPMPWALHTKAFKSQSIVRVGDPKNGQDLVYLKVNIEDQDSAAAIEAEDLNRAMLRKALEASTVSSVRVPEYHGTLRVGAVSYRMESVAEGTELSRIVWQRNYFVDARRVENDFTRFFEHLIEFTEILQKVCGAPVMNPGWREIPSEFRDLPETHNAIDESRYLRNSSDGPPSTWIQHGDLSVENVCFDKALSTITVFDWNDMAAGFPPLYDLFAFLFSVGYLRPANQSVRFANGLERWIASFRATFLSDTEFARIARTLILQACNRLNIEPELIPPLLIDFLLIRTHYYRTKSEVQRQIHLRLLQLCLEQDCFVFGEYQFKRHDLAAVAALNRYPYWSDRM